MRCALDASPLLGARTGVATFTSGLLEGLRGRADLSAYALSWRGRSMLREVLPVGVTSGWSVPAGPLLRLWAHSDLVTAERILDLVDDVDVVHGTNFVVPPTRRAGRVVTVHDLTAVRFPEMCTSASLRYPALVRRAVATGAWVHTPSEFVAEEVRDAFPGAGERVRAIHHGVTVSVGDPTRGRELAGYERFVFALATVEPRKDLPVLIEAFSSIAANDRGLGLVLAGGDGWGPALPEAPQVRRLGYISDDDRAALLSAATVFAFPSRYEGFGLPPLEAMAAGVPVVASDVGAVREVCDGAARLVPVGDADAFASALLDAMERPDTAPGTQRAAAFTWDRCGAEMLDLYHDVMADNPKTRDDG